MTRGVDMLPRFQRTKASSRMKFDATDWETKVFDRTRSEFMTQRDRDIEKLPARVETIIIFINFENIMY